MESMLKNIEGSQCFWTNNGVVIGSILELPEVLKNMNDHEFKYHVNSDKNDFSKWIDEVIGDRKLAKSLKRIKRKDSTIKKINARIKELN